MAGTMPAMRPCVLLALTCACAAAAPATKPVSTAAPDRTVSVLEIHSKLSPADRVDPGYVADRLRAEVLASGVEARVISRENMLVLLQAQGKDLSECEGECEVETGRRIGADYVVSGELLRVGDSLKASLRLHETRGGALLAAATAAGITPEDLDANLAVAMRRLLAPLSASAASRPPRTAEAFDARAFAASQPTPVECEAAARRLRGGSPDQAWAALVACIERPRWPRGAFTDLERLTGGFWDRDLATRADAPRVVARVVAMRGGDVEGDLPLLQKSRVPVFTLAAAVREPQLYKGRWILVRGALTAFETESGRPAARVRETSLRATSREVQDGATARWDRSGTVSVQRDVQTTRYGDARSTKQISGSVRSEYSRVKQRYDNERVETGREALGRLAQPDPFLEPDKDFVFLARFDGVSQGRGDAPLAMLSIAGYFQPNALLVQ